jgi:hypothetical protein
MWGWKARCEGSDSRARTSWWWISHRKDGKAEIIREFDGAIQNELLFALWCDGLVAKVYELYISFASHLDPRMLKYDSPDEIGSPTTHTSPVARPPPMDQTSPVSTAPPVSTARGKTGDCAEQKTTMSTNRFLPLGPPFTPTPASKAPAKTKDCAHQGTTMSTNQLFPLASPFTMPPPSSAPAQRPHSPSQSPYKSVFNLLRDSASRLRPYYSELDQEAFREAVKDADSLIYAGILIQNGTDMGAEVMEVLEGRSKTYSKANDW